MADTTFSIDLGERYIKIAEIEQKGEKYLAKSMALNKVSSNIYTIEKITDDEMIASTLKKMVTDHGIKKKGVNIIIPDSRSYTRIMEMPVLTEKELISAIKYQADQFVPIPLEKINLDLEILHEDKLNKKILILLVASDKLLIEKVSRIVEMSGLIPEIIENEASSALHLLSEINKKQLKEKSLTLFINFGNQSTSLYLYDSLINLPVEIYNFSIGYNIFEKDIQANYSLSQEEITRLLETQGFSDKPSQYNLNIILSTPFKEFISEIQRLIISTKTKFNTNINHVYIFGEGFKINSIKEKLSTALEIETKILDIYAYFIQNNVVDSIKSDLPLFIPTIGANLT